MRGWTEVSLPSSAGRLTPLPLPLSLENMLIYPFGKLIGFGSVLVKGNFLVLLLFYCISNVELFFLSLDRHLSAVHSSSTCLPPNGAPLLPCVQVMGKW